MHVGTTHLGHVQQNALQTPGSREELAQVV
jgi:hypothetical protein